MTQQKRQRELQRRERAEEKAARRAARKAEVGDESVPPGVDPQIAHIQPGPPPPRED